MDEGTIQNPQKPLDDVVAALIHNAKAEGFTLGLLERAGAGADGTKRVEVSVVETLPPVDIYEPPPPLRGHTLGDTSSLIDFATKYGSKEKSLVLYTDAGVCLILDELPEKGQRESINLSWTFARDYTDWSGLVNQRSIDHRSLLKFLILHAHNLTDPTVLLSMRSITATMTVKMDSDLKDEGETVGVVMTSGKGDALARFPKSIDIRIPIMRDDVGDDGDWAFFTVRLEVEMPTEPNKPVTFLLLCNEWEVRKSDRIDREIEKVREGLPDYLIVRGEHRSTPRRLGAKANGVT